MHDPDFDWQLVQRSEAARTLQRDPFVLATDSGPARSLLMLNGPNLNLLGQRDPTQYGTFTLADVEAKTRATAHDHGFTLDAFQSNYEGALVDLIQVASSRYAGILLNAGALTHYSYALRDAIDACGIPVYEIHISDIALRESFRQVSVIHSVCAGQVKGLGLESYPVGAQELMQLIVQKEN
ncbi:MAG: 3-dehydroquinate dehydratase [Eubacteriales bacterium]|nr:3-dehydroquinate dehydratase [Eubacteriales bacterium]